jgi:hypothetical protein
MATIDDAIFAVVQRNDLDANQKNQLIGQLRKALPTDRWTFRYVIWGLIAVVIIPTLGVLILWAWNIETFDASKVPQGLISLASTALGALAAYITPGIHQSGQAPQGQAPQGQAPQGQAPQGQAPQGQAPQGQAPQGQGQH